MHSNRLRRVLTTLVALPPWMVLTHAQSPAPARAACSPAAAEVWALEDACWRCVRAGDVGRYLTLWHGKFIGWPCGSDHPGGKPTIGDWVKRIRDEKVRFRYAVTREGTVELGDAIVVRYRTPMVSAYPDGRVEGQVNGRDEPRKITNTWSRTASGWKIIGGMCASVATPH